MEWINDGFLESMSETGRLPVENAAVFTTENRCAVAWSGDKIKIRIPWTLLYFYDPTQMNVINGAVTTDGGFSYSILPERSDGIALSFCIQNTVVSMVNRYTWEPWLVVPATTVREKKSLYLVETGLRDIADFAN
jgi:hypothetical protein